MRAGLRTRYLSVMLFHVLLSITIAQAQNIPLKSPDQVKLVNLEAQSVMHNGKEGLRLTYKAADNMGDRPHAIVPDVSFHNGTIELELSGKPNPDAGSGARGFVGIAFRVDEDNLSSYECFYLRPTNGRADDQMRRNHTLQYISHPAYTWNRLREESPGMYESYTDIGPDEWIKVKIVVSGQKAQLYVNNMDYPCLIVNDLKHGDSSGMIALWMEPSTEAYFRNMIITPE